LGRLCGDQWSDFNSHDPGITILEQLCFALTELAYRSQWPIEDLLASAGPDWQPAAEEILNGDPVTRDDLIALVRALGCEEVLVGAVEQPELPLYFQPTFSASVHRNSSGENQGIPPVAGDLHLDSALSSGFDATSQAPLAPWGAWRVAARLRGAGEGDGPCSLLTIAQRLHGARLLGRDFNLEVLDPFAVAVRAELEVDPALVRPGLMGRLHACLNQAIRHAASHEGERGLRSGALIQALLTLPEVRQVLSIALASSPQGPWQPWHLPLPGQGACLDPASSIQLSHRGVPLAPPPALELAPALEMATPQLGPSPLSPISPEPPNIAPAPVPVGQRRDLRRFQSIARQLPAIYGVGLAGLPAEANSERQHQSRQLRTYLLFFDQLLAHGQGQLAQAMSLLAPIQASDPRPLDTEAVLPAHDPELPPTATIDQRQALRASAPANAGGQRADLLAHLLQRFGEELNPLGPHQPAVAETLVRARSEFLRRIALLSGGRGSGADLLSPVPETLQEDGQGAFAERLRRKLGLALEADGSPPLLVIEHLLLRPLPDDSSQRVQGGEDPIPFLSDVTRPDPWSGRVSVVLRASRVQPAPMDPSGGRDSEPARLEAEGQRDRWLRNVVRRELPAHLEAELHLLDDDPSTPDERAWSAIAQAWCHFRQHLRAYRLAGLGVDVPADPLGSRLLSLRLRDSRDRLISLLRIGLPWPLRGIPLPEQVMVATNQNASIELAYSQRGVRYQLVEVASGAPVGKAADGTDGPLTLTTPAITQDLTLRVQASVLSPSPVATANGRLRSTLLAGEVVVVEGVDASLPLRLLDAKGNPLPPLHPEATALLAAFGEGLLVEVGASQEGVVYEVIDNAQRSLQPDQQTPLSAKETGTSGPILLTLSSPAGEDRDLTVRASLKRQRGQALSEQHKVLSAVLPLRVRANPALPLRLEAPVVAPDALAVIAIGAPAGSGESASQTSVMYKLWTRQLADDDWRFESPATAAEITVIDDALTSFSEQPAGGPGNGAVLNLEQSVSGEGIVVAALARKEHRLSLYGSNDERHEISEVPLRQAAVAFSEPDSQRQLILRREVDNPNIWSFWGGQPGVAYSVSDETAQPALAEAVPIPELADAPAGLRGIGRQRLGRDLLVAASEGPPRTELRRDPAKKPKLAVRARYLRSGVEVALERPPILVWVEPPAVGRGESAKVLIAGLAADQTGRLLRGETLLAEGRADGEGRLRLATGPLPGGTTLQLDVGVRCAVPIAQGVNTDPEVRVLGFQPLQEGAPAHLLDWGASAEVEVAESQVDVSYTLINAAERDKPLEEQQILCDPVQGTGGSLRLVSAGMREDIDLLVRGTRLLDRAGLQQASGLLNTVVPLRVRANPAVPIALVEPVLDPAAASLVWVGDDAMPSQLSVTYKAWSLPIGPEDWQWHEPATPSGTAPSPSHPPAASGTLRPVSPPSVESLEAAGWSGRGKPKKGTGSTKRGTEGRLQLSLGQAGADAVVAVVASKKHNPFPLGDQQEDSVSSQVLLKTLANQLTTPDPERRLALVAEPWGWRFVGGEAGCYYSFQGGTDKELLGPPVYVHQRSTEGTPTDWGLERLRVSVDLAVAGDGGPGLATGPASEALRTAVVQARRAFSATHCTLRHGLLLVTQEPPPPHSDDTCMLVIWGLQDDERASLEQGPAASGAPARLASGAVAEGTELILLIGREGEKSPWRLPVRVLAAAPPSP
ncbi:MAG: hypothetical protein VKI42_10320, partial [Synechococcaceae cyanobacterium]|nr:hypothetical protein [Synechococcaceae cyanobacterium]